MADKYDALKEEYNVGQNKNKKDVIDQLLDQIDFHGMTAEELAGENSLLKKLTSRFYSKALDAEMDEHLGYKKNDNAGDNSGNSRNGYTSKTVITDDNGTIEVHVPRDIQHHLQQVYGVAINWEGRKEVLGLWLADTEGAKFWMSVLTDIKNRGVEQCPSKTGDWQLISLQYYLTGVFPALINPCHLHRIYDRVVFRDALKLFFSYRVLLSPILYAKIGET